MPITHASGLTGPTFSAPPRSVCPPYNDMDFDELVRSLEASKVVSDRSFLIFEYPKEVGQSLATNLGPLTRLVNRTYGRTTVAIYGPDL